VEKVERQDILGTRTRWVLSEDADHEEGVESYAGEFTHYRYDMGEDCCWHDTFAERVTVGKAIDLVNANEVAVVQLRWIARGLPNLQAPLTRALHSRGMRWASEAP
jgi:hypothetical protein